MTTHGCYNEKPNEKSTSDLDSVAICAVFACCTQCVQQDWAATSGSRSDAVTPGIPIRSAP